MKSHRLITALTAIALSALAGCSSQQAVTATGDQTIRTVAGAEIALTAAEREALIYTSLPPCTAPQTNPVCADPAIKARIKAADNTAYNAVMAARQNAGTIAAAVSAIEALQSLIPASAAASAQ